MSRRGTWFVALVALAGWAPATACSSSSSPVAANDGGTPPPPTSDDGAAGDEPDALDFGAPSDTYPAFAPVMPQASDPQGNPTLGDVTAVPVLFAGDPEAAVVTDLLSKYAAAPEWTTQVGEYGVGKLTVAAPVVLHEAAPTALADPDIDPWLRARLDGTHPEFGPNDPATLAKTVFVLVYPPGTTVTRLGFTSCSFFGYHSASLGTGGDAGVDGGPAPNVPLIYTVIPRCAAAPLTEVDTLTEAITHELMEAATNPLGVQLGEAYDFLDDAHIIWGVGMGGSEIADLCQVPGSTWAPASIGHAIGRAWSNKSANAHHDPCVPIPNGEVYFNAFINPTDTIAAGLVKTKGVTVPVGQTRTFDVMLFSDQPTGGPFTLSVRELKTSGGASNVLTLALDRSSGVNGEKVHLTVHATGNTPNNTSAIAMISKLGTKETVWFTPVALK